MAKIRAKDVLKGSVKALDKGAIAAERIKNGIVQTKDKAEQSVAPAEQSPGQYAQDRVSVAAEQFTKEGVHQFSNQGKKSVAETRNNLSKAKHYFENRGAAEQPVKKVKNAVFKPQERAKKLAEKNIRSSYTHVKYRATGSMKSGGGIGAKATHATRKSTKGAGKKGLKAAGKSTLKTARRSVKTAQQTGKAAIKTAGYTAKAAQKSAEVTVKAARLSAQGAKAAAKATIEGVKVAAKATFAALKALIVAAKALVAAIVAGGWVAMVILLIICFIGLLVASPFGMFFSGDANGGTSPIREVVAQTSNEFSGKVIDIVNNNPHDELRMNVINRGYKRADNWMDVLAIFAISTATQNADAAEVVTMDEAKAAKIRELFWEMASIEHRMEQEIHEEAILDEEGNDSGETTIITRNILMLDITFKGADEMATAKGFTRQQKEILTEMLGGEYDELFRELIGNIGLVSMTGDGSGAVGTGTLLWPVPSTDRVNSPFGSRVDPITGKFDTHLGIDIPGLTGTSIVASDGGTVASTSVDASYGNHALIDHGNGTSTLYAHMDNLLVSAGDAIEQGQPLGGMGATGRVTGVHLHYEVWVNGGRVDPLGYFDNYTTAW